MSRKSYDAEPTSKRIPETTDREPTIEDNPETTHRDSKGFRFDMPFKIKNESLNGKKDSFLVSICHIYSSLK